VYEISDLIGGILKIVLAFSIPNFELPNHGNARNYPIIIGGRGC